MRYKLKDTEHFTIDAFGRSYNLDELPSLILYEAVKLGIYPTPSTIGNYLTFTSSQDGSTIRLNKSSADFNPSNTILEYSTDNGSTWDDYTWNGATGLEITLDTNESVKFRGVSIYSENTANYYQFVMTGRLAGSGDATSLLNFVGGDCPIRTYGFYRLFSSCGSLTTAPELPATTLADHCYSNMFQGCSSLTTAPTLPATTLAPYCYYSMFFGCTSLTTAPDLPATTLASDCYDSMFFNCSRLTSVGDLSNATSIGNSMFSGCSNSSLTLEFSSNLVYMGDHSLTGVTGVIYFNKLVTTQSRPIYNEFNSENTESTNYYILKFDVDSIPQDFSLFRFADYGYKSSGAKGKIHYMNYTVYTNYEPLKNMWLNYADSYTIVTVYHLDGTPW